MRGLSKKELILLVGAVLAVGGFFISKMDFSKFEGKKNVRDQIKLKKRMIKQAYRLLSTRDQILEESGKYGNQIKKEGPEAEEAKQIKEEITQLAEEADVFLLDFEPFARKKTKIFSDYKIEIEVESTISNIGTFIYNVQQSESLFKIDKMRISPKTDSYDILKAYFTITKVFIPY